MAIIYTYPKKNNPTSTDLVLISDFSDGNKTKNATISSLQSSLAGVSSINTLTGAVLLGSTTDVSNNNLTRITDAATNAIRYKLADQLNAITAFEEGTHTPLLEYYDQASTSWIEWTKNPDGSTNADRTYNQQVCKYVRANNNVSLSARCYVQNDNATFFDCGGVRITLPFAFNSACSLAVGFTQPSSFASQNLTSMSRSWVSGPYSYMLREEAIAGTSTTVFGPNLDPQIYFQTFASSITYRLGTGQTTFNMSGSAILS